jgi:hypothetical protein
MYARVKGRIDDIQPELLAFVGFDDRSGIIHTGVDNGYIRELETVRIASQGGGLIAVVGDIDAVVTVWQRLRGTRAGEKGTSHKE